MRRSPDLHAGALGENRPSPGVQDLGKRLQVMKEVLKADPEISFPLASNKRIFQSKASMGMSRDQEPTCSAWKIAG